MRAPSAPAIPATLSGSAVFPPPQADANKTEVINAKFGYLQGGVSSAWKGRTVCTRIRTNPCSSLSLMVEIPHRAPHYSCFVFVNGYVSAPKRTSRRRPLVLQEDCDRALLSLMASRDWLWVGGRLDEQGIDRAQCGLEVVGLHADDAAQGAPCCRGLSVGPTTKQGPSRCGCTPFYATWRLIVVRSSIPRRAGDRHDTARARHARAPTARSAVTRAAAGNTRPTRRARSPT
jgi:hypothetical protein